MLKLGGLSLAAALSVAASGCAGIPRMLKSHDPLTIEEHRTLAAAYAARDMKDLSAREYRAILRQSKNDPAALIGLGNASFEQGKFRQAERYFRRALKAEPGHPAASNNVAMILVQKKKRLDEAEKLVLNVLDRSGQLRPYLLDTLANIYILQGEKARAEAVLTEALAKADPANSPLVSHLEESRRKLDPSTDPK